MSDEKTKVEEQHWLVRPGTIRNLWRGGLALLAVLVLGDLVVAAHPHFDIDGYFGFYAWYGFTTCAAMVIGAKGLSLFLKRNDTYYDDPDPGGGGNV